jgi:hypothetical protein
MQKPVDIIAGYDKLIVKRQKDNPGIAENKEDFLC